MNIKKLPLFVIIILLSLTLSSCSFLKPEYFSSNDNKIGNTRLQKIIGVLEKKDKEGLKKMFSPNALKEAKNIDSEIDYIMNYYKGKIKSKKGSLISRSDSKENGEMISILYFNYTVTTDKDTYIVYFTDKVVDSKNIDNVGLYRLEIIKKSDLDKETRRNGDSTVHAGVYCPDAAK